MNVGEVFVRMALDSKQYEKDLGRLEGVTEKKAMTLGSIFKGAFSFTLGMGMFEALKRGFNAVVGESVGFNSMMEEAQIGFTTMLGSAEKAQSFLEQMADFAARTPFEFPDLLTSAKRMIAMGFAAGDVLPILEAVGNATGGLGLGKDGINRITLALGQMRAKAKVSGEEMRQLTEAGVPAWEILAEAMGKSTAEVMKLSERGLIPADEAIQMLTEGMNKRFPDMMKKMEGTWQGVTSTIKDVWRMTMGALTSGLFKSLTTWLQGVRDWAVDFYNTFRKFGLDAALRQAFGSGFADAVNAATSVLRRFWKALVYVTGLLRKHWQTVKFVGTVMLTYAAATRLASTAAMVFQAITLALNGQLSAKIPILSLVSTAMGIYRVQMALASVQGVALTGVLAKLRIALYSFYTALGPIGWVLLAISAAVAGGLTLWNKYSQSVQKTAGITSAMADANNGIAGAVDDANKSLKDQAEALNEAGKAANKNLQSFDEVHQIQEDMAGGIDSEMLDPLANMNLEDFGSMPGFDADSMMQELEAMKPTLAGFWQWIKDGAGNLWDSVKQKWSSFTGWVKSWGIWSWIKDRWDGLKTWAGNLWDGVKGKWGSFKDWVLSWAGPLWDGVKQVWGSFKEWAGRLWDSVKLKWGLFKDWVISWAGPLWDFIKVRWNDFKTWAGDIWEGVKAKWQTFIDWIKQTWNNTTALLFETWGSIKDTASTVWGLIRDYIIDPVKDAWVRLKGIWEKVKTYLANTWNGIKTTAQNVWSGVTDAVKGAINGIIGFINKFIASFNKIKIEIPSVNIPLVGEVGGFTIGMPQIQPITPLKEGGLVTSPTLAMVGEAGDEAVIPLGRSGFTKELAESVGQSVYRAFMDAIRITQASGTASDNEKELVLKLDNTVVARILLPAIIKEGQRQGLNLVVQPQGV